MTDATMPPLDHPEPHTMKWSDLELAAIHDYARAYAALRLAAQGAPVMAEAVNETLFHALALAELTLREHGLICHGNYKEIAEILKASSQARKGQQA